MKTRSSLVLPLSLLAALFFGLSKAGTAQDDQQYQQDQQDPPSRVAHLNYVQGSVSYQPSGEQDWVQADINRPLTTGDNLWADQNSRGELHIGSTALRIGDQTGISFLNLNDQAVQIQLAQGTLDVHVRHIRQDEAYEIDTPNLAFSIVRPGDYRLSADQNGASTVVTVYEGQGTVTGKNQSFDVTPGQRAIFTGTDQLYENVQPARPDAFDEWARSREEREEHAESVRYVSPDVTGYEELDDYGSWRSDPEYGHYWVPNSVSVDWAPYHEGHWCWVAPWGWTWVDDEPWGFAPFHYGRWAVIGGGWGWVPGPVAVAPVYAPALVGFVGGGGFGVAVGFGDGVGVGWFPLGPRDVYVPAYRVSPRYVEEVNVSNTTVINRTTVVNVYNNYTVNHVTNVNYTYANNTRAVTVVNRDAFVSGRPVARSAMRVDAAEIQDPRVVTTAQLTPTRASVVGPVAVARAKPPASIENRRVVTKMTPAPQAAPIGRPRPSANPNLSPAVLNRSGYSPQLQTVRATAAARAPARGPAANEASSPANAPETGRPGNPAEPNRPATAPNQPRPNEAQPNREPNRPFTPPNRSNENTRPNENPNRPATPPNETPPNERQPNRPFTPPNRPTENPTPNENPNRPAENPRPNETPNRPATQPRPNQPQPNREPNRPFTPPNRPAENPNRATPPAPPAEQPRPEERPRTVTPPPERQPNRPAEQPRPETRPPAAARPAEPQPSRPAEQPRPEARPRTAPPPQERPAARPPERQPPPQPEKPKEKPKPQPQL
jgi:hypothetical protein